MKTQRIKLDPDVRTGIPAGRINKRRLDETTEEEIALQQKADDAESMQDAARLRGACASGSDSPSRSSRGGSMCR